MPAPVVSADLNVLTVGVQEFLIDSSNNVPNVSDVDGPSTGAVASTFFDGVAADDIDTITIESRLDSDGSLTADQFTFDQQVLLDYATAYNAASTAAGGASIVTIQFAFATVSASEVAIAVAYLVNGTGVAGGQYNVTGIGTSSMTFAFTAGDFIDTLNLNPTVSALNTDIADAFLSSVQVTVADDADRDFVITAQNPPGSVDPANPLTLTGTPNNAPEAIDDAFDGGALSTLDENFTDIDIAALITDNDLDAEGTIDRDNIISVTNVLTVSSGAIDPAGLSSPATVELLGNQLFLRADGADLDPIQNGNTSDFNYLDEGQSAVITFEYTIDDNEDGVSTDDGTDGVAEAQDTATVAVTITGSNDAVEFVEENNSGLTDGFVDSNGNLVFSDLDGQIVERVDGAGNENLGASSTGGSVRFVDLDSDDTHGFSVLAPAVGGIQGPSPFSGLASGGTIGVEGTTNSAPAGYIGSFVTSLESDSNDASTGFVGEVSWTFSVDDSQIDLLSGDQSFTQSYEITIFEEAEAGQTATSFTQTVTILIQGTNDAPVISIEGTDTVGATLVEDVDGAGTDASGTISVTDVDVADSVLQSVSLTSITRVPTITNGVLDDVEDPIAGTVDLENDGRPSDDELESMISLVGGANGIVVPSLSSVLQSDTGDATGTSGTITWEFDASGGNSEQVFDYLAQDEEVVITYTVTVTDFDSEDDDAVPGTEPSGTSDSIDINVTVTGTNDAVEIVAGGDLTGDVTEETETDELGTTEGANAADRSTSGTIEFTDLDFSDTHTASVVKVSSSLNAAPTTAPDTNLTDVAGGTDPEVLGDAYGTVAIINFESAQGDPNEPFSAGTPGLGEAQPDRVGSLVWEYTVGDAVLEQLGEGETMVEVFEITVKDIDGGDNVTEQGGDATQLITITATGTNDQPIFDSTAGTANELIDVTFNEADVEDGEQLAVEGITDIDIHDEVTVSLTNVSLAGDGADGAGSSGLTVDEATDAFGLLDVDGNLEIGNGISGDTLIRDDATTGTIDSEILVDSDDVNAAANVFDSLGEGESVQITYTLEIADDSGATNNTDEDTVTVTVIGDNDDVTIQEAASTLSGSVTEVTELEAPAVAGLSNTPSEGQGGADDVLTATGSIEFADLDIDDEHTPTFAEGTTTRTDANGAADSTFLGTFAVTINAGDEATVDALGDGRNVGFVDWTFTVADEDIEFLGEGQSIQQTYTVTIEDESIHDADAVAESAATVDVTVTIFGTNDRPIIESGSIVVPFAVSETLANDGVDNATFAAAGLGAFTVSDIDVSDVVTVDIDVELGGEGQQGGLSGTGLDDGITEAEFEALINSPNDGDTVVDGSSTEGTIEPAFNTAASPSFEYLSEGEELEVTVTATVSDDSGLSTGTDIETLTLTITGENDDVEFTHVAGLGTTEGAVSEISEDPADARGAETVTDLTATGQLAFTDLDLNDDYAISVESSDVSSLNPAVDNQGQTVGVENALGTLSFDIIDGARERGDNNWAIDWTYTVSDSVFEYLQEGETATETFVVRLTDDSQHDGAGNPFAGVTEVITVTITGTNDAPEITLPPLPAPFSASESDANNGVLIPIGVEDIDLLDEVTASVSVVTGGNGAGTGSDPFDGGISGEEFEDLLSINGGAVDGTVVIDTVSTAAVVNVDFNGTGPNADPFAFDYLSEGEELNVTITGTIDDGQGLSNSTDSEEIVVTIVGENDQAFILDAPDGGIYDGFVEEVIEFFPVPNANQPEPETTTILGGVGGLAEGFIGFADFDFDDTHRVDVVDASGFSNIGDVAVEIIIPNTGTLVRPDDNPLFVGGVLEWVYSVADGDIEFLGAGESITEVFTIELYETSPYTLTELLADTQDVTITAFGRNDAPEVLGGDFSAGLVEGDEDGDGVGTGNNADGSGPGVTEVEPLIATGSISVEDLDITDVVIVEDVVTANVAISGTAPALSDLADGSQPPIFEDGDDVVTIDDIADMLTFGAGQGDTTIIANGDTTGSIDWVFNSGSVDFDFLAQGEELIIDYTITIRDDSGATDAVDGAGAPTGGESDFATTTVTITITGTNDAPVIDEASSILGGEIVELEEDDPLEQDDPNGQVVESVRFGTIVYNDVDSTDLHTIQSVALGNGAAPDGSFVGNFDVDVASQFLDQIEWTLNVLDSEIEHLREGESAVQSYAVVVNDNKGGSDTTVVTVTLTGTNDRPDITVGLNDSDAETLTENFGVEDGPDAGLSVSGTLSLEDIDIHDVVVSSSAILSSESDQVGQPDDTTLDGMFSVVGGLTGDAPNSFAPNTGFAVGETTGILTWTFDSGAESFDYLADGESLVIEYTVTVQDDSGIAVSDTDTQVVTITINGTNDRPIVTAETNVAATIAEDNETVGVPVDQEQAITASGSFEIEDLDVTNEVTATVTSVVSSGNDNDAQNATPSNGDLQALLTLGANPVIANGVTTGTVTWDFNAADDVFDYLAVGESIELAYTITIDDGRGQTDEPSTSEQVVTITVTGTNDRPEIGAEVGQFQALDEEVGPNAGLTATGSIAVSDADTSEVVSISDVSLDSTFGVDSDPSLTGVDLLSFFSPQTGPVVASGDNDGTINWTFDSGSFGFDYLDDQESITLVYAVTVADEQGESDLTSVTITINGTNDAPTIAAATTVTGEVDEPGAAAVNANGVFTVEDLDTSDIVNLNGITVASSGVTTAIAGDATLLGLFSVSGNPVVAAGDNQGDMTWNFDLGAEPNVFDYLADGEQAVLTYSVELVDDSGATVVQDVVVTVTGTNDTPTIDVSNDVRGNTRSIDETDEEANENGFALITDADLNDTITVTTELASATHIVDVTGGTVGSSIGQPADAVLDAFFDAGESPVDRAGTTTGDITWTFASDIGTPETFDYLDDGEALELVYTIFATDILGASDSVDIFITINGTNDGPAFTGGDTTGSVVELAEADEAAGAQQTASGTLTYTDLDLSDVNTATAVGAAGNRGTLAVTVNDDVNASNESVDWAYTVDDSAIDDLAEGQIVVDTFDVTVFDDSGESDVEQVSVTITGANDAPVFDIDIVPDATITETDANAAGAGASTITGVTDVDLIDTVDLTQSAVIASTASTTITEAELLSFITITPTDVIDGTETSDTFEVAYSAPTDRYDFLSSGQELEIVYTLTATDGEGATDTIVSTTTIVGENDGFVLDAGNSDLTGGVTELADGDAGEGTATLSATGSITLTDADIDDTYSAVVQAETNEGDLSITGITLDANGGAVVDWEFTVADADVEDLRAGEEQVETFDILFTETSPVDGDQTSFTQSVTVTITGSNDAPDITVEAGDLESAGLVEVDAPLSTAGTLSVEDLDVGDTVTVASALANVVTTAPAGTPADPVLDAMFSVDTAPVIDNASQNGVINWAFDSSTAPENFDYLAAGEVITLTYEVTATDDSPSGATSDVQTVQITILGTNDAPVIDDVVSVVTGEVTELLDGAPAETIALNEVGGTIVFSDLDLSNTHFTGFTETGTGAGPNGEFLGSFSIDAIQDTPDNVGNSFQWSLTIQDAELEYLAEGQTISQSYSVFVSDQDDGTDTTTVTLTFTGRNDAPEFVLQAGDVTDLVIDEQDGTLVEAGTLSVEDIDLIDEVSLSVATSSVAGVTADLVQADFDGLLSLTTANPVLTDSETLDTFTYVFNSGGEAYDFLNDGESLVATYTVTATDLEGATALQDITVTIVGTNDSPVIQVILADGDTNLAELDEGDAGLTATGTMSVQDVDISDVVTVAAALQTVNDTAGGGAPDQAVLAGFFSVDAGEVVSNTETEGKINWAFDSGTEAFDYLAEGEVLELEYLVTAFDGDENDPTTETDTEVVTVMITGTNDAPTIEIGASDSAAADLTEGDGGLTADGTLSIEDLDLSDIVTPSVAVTSVAGSGAPATTGLIASIGTAGFAAMISISPDPVVAAGATTGSLAWAFDSNGEAFDELAVGEELTLTYTVTVEDTEAATATQDVVITITGTNDAPTFTAGVITDAVEDDGVRTLDLTALGDDIDSDDDGDSLIYTVESIPADAGTATIDANGVLSFDVGSDFQELAVGQQQQVGVAIRATDQHGEFVFGNVTVTVTGVNDNPTLAAGVGAADEDGAAITVDLAALGDDIDSDDDGTTLTYSIVTGPAAGQGSAVINGTSLEFDPGTDFQELALNETTDVVITIEADDGNGGTVQNTVTITVTGQNDAPTLDDGTIAAGEDGPSADLDLATLADDVDSDDDASTLIYTIASQPVDGGVVTILGSTVTFDPNGDFEELAVGETTDVTFEVSAEDSNGAVTTATVTVTVTGVNDAPTLAAGSADATEDGAVSVVDLAALGDDIDSDDDGSTLTYSILNGPSAGEGSATVNGTDLEFDPGADFQELAVGETTQVLIDVQADDGNGGLATNTMTITVTGVNDDPTLAAGLGAADEDGAAITVDLAALGDDIDSDDDGSTLTYSIQAGGEPSEGSASITGTTLEFDPGADFQDLSLGETRDVTVTVVAEDQHGASAVNTVTITVTGENDAPTMEDAAADAVEDGPTVDVALSALGDDVDSEDTGASLNYAITTLPAEGSASIAGTTLTFDPGADFQDLAEGETRDVTVGVTATDAQNASSNEGTITFTVTGTNDAPIIGAGTFTASVTELPEGAVGQETQVTAVTNAIDFGDVDLSDGHTVLTNPLGAGFAGTFIGVLDDFSTGDGEGSVDWTFTVSDAELAFLGEGESVVQEYNVSVVDDAPTSLSDTVTVSVTLIGANDAPDAVEIDLGLVAEDAGSTTFDLLDPASVNDPDAIDDLDTQNVTVTSSDGRAVTFGIDDETGALDIDPGQFEDLASGETLDLTVDYEITDGLETITNTATLTVEGANQAPVIVAADDSGAVTEDEAALLEATGLVTFTDVDLSDGHVLSVEAAASNALGGSLDAVERQAATGGVIGEALWTYTLASVDADGLAVGETETEQFTITLDDGNGGTATQDVTVTVTGVNDDPTLDGAALGADEGGAPVDLDLSALGDDVDSDDDGTTLTYAIIGQPTEGSASISGSTLTFDPGTDFVDLAVGETRDVTVTIQATDSNGAVSTAAVVTITVTGTDDDCFIATAAAEVFDGGVGFDKVDFSNSDAAIVIALGVSASGGFAEGDSLISIEGIIGTDFDDEIRGDDEDNSLSGGAGNDTIEAGAGDDFLDGGEGIDTLDYSNAAPDASDLGVFVNLALQGTAQSNTEGNDTFVNFENVIGSAFSDFLAGDGGVNQIFGEDGGDFLVGGAGDDGLFGGNGFDAIEGGAGADSIFGGTNEDGTPEGDIATYFQATGPLVFDFRTDFSDAANVSSAEVKEDIIGDDIEGFAGTSAFSNTVFAGDETNFFLGGAAGDEYNGGAGTDQILGLAGDDTIRGNGGVDGIIGEGGNDLLFGGADGDVFFFDGVNEGDDTIFDFELGADLIAFTGDAVNGLADLTISTVDVGGDAGTADTLIEYSGNGTNSSITVLDVDENAIQASILFF